MRPLISVPLAPEAARIRAETVRAHGGIDDEHLEEEFELVRGELPACNRSSPEFFEAMFRAAPDLDPWGFGRSLAEQRRFDHVAELVRLGFRRGLEIGCANGELTARIAGRGQHLVALDASAAASHWRDRSADHQLDSTETHDTIAAALTAHGWSRDDEHGFEDHDVMTWRKQRRQPRSENASNDSGRPAHWSFRCQGAEWPDGSKH